MVKCLPTMWEIRVQSLGLEDPLEKEMATHSRILAWRIPCTEELSRLRPLQGRKVWDTTELLNSNNMCRDKPERFSRKTWTLGAVSAVGNHATFSALLPRESSRVAVFFPKFPVHSCPSV